MTNSTKVVNMPSTSTQKRDFQSQIKKVIINLPVNFDIKDLHRIQISLVKDSGLVFDYFYDYLPNIDINCYIQYAVQQYNHECSETDSAKSDKSL